MKTQILSIIFIALMLFSNQDKSQSDFSFTTRDTTLANTFFARAEELYEKAQYDSSINYFEKASVIYEELATQSNLTNTYEKYIKCINGIGVSLQELGRYDNAMEYLSKASEIGLKKFGENHPLIADNYSIVGMIYHHKNKHDTALDFHKKSLAIRLQSLGENHPDVATSFHNIGAVYFSEADYDKSLEYYNKSLAIRLQIFGKNHRDVATSYYKMANVYINTCNYDRALEYLNQALAIRQYISSEAHHEVADLYNSIAIVYGIKEDDDKALEYFNKSLAINIQSLGENHYKVARSYFNIGAIYLNKKDLEKATDYFYRSLSISQQLFSENHFMVSADYHHIGVTFFENKDYNKALEYYNKSLAINLQLFGENHSNIASNYKSIGQVYQEKGDYDKTLEYFNKCLTIEMRTYGQHHPVVAISYRNFGDLYCKQKNFQKALSYFQKAILSLIPAFKDTAIYSNPPLKNMLLEIDLVQALESKANAFYQYYSIKMNDIRDVDMSFTTYQLASELVDKTRSSYRAEGSKLFLGERTATLFDKAIQTALKLFEITQNNEYKEQAFLFAEKAKSSILLASLQESRAKQFAAIPDTLLEQEKELRIDLAFYDTQIEEEQDSLKLKDLEAKHFALSVQYEKLIDKIETDFPKYYDMKYQTHTATISELQRSLDDKSAVLNYFIGESLIHIFVVSHDGFDVMSLDKDTLFEDTIESLNKSIKKLNAYGFIETSYQAYNLLIKPVEQFISNKEKLIIIPHSILYKIPYEALLSYESGEEVQTYFTKLDYLINRFEICYHYSATLYLNSVSTRGKPLAESWQKDNLFIGFAPVFSDEANNGYILASNLPAFDLAYAESDVRSISLDGKRFNELQYSEKEVENIVKMYENSRSEAIGFFHTNATEDNFKSHVSNYKYVHIATHGIINEEKPQLSGIIFSQPTDSDYVEDGILYSNETYSLDLNADLVVLSSCESGIGKLVRGEGLMALTRGFLYSGASNIVVSLWKVSDKHTSQLMVEFYKNILAEKSYARSLREAKLKMIENPATAFPKSWSSFVLLGE